jgi:hypothetical protein
MTPELPDLLRVALQVIDVLDELGIPYHLGGSFASSVHGIPRQTQDIDLIVELPITMVDTLAAKLGGDFYLDGDEARSAVARRGSFNLIHLDTAVKVDLFVRGDEPFDAAEFSRHRPELVQIEPPRRIHVKSAEDILLRKLQWYRAGGEASGRQWTDALGIVAAQRDRLDRAYLERWALELGVADLLSKALQSA